MAGKYEHIDGCGCRMCRQIEEIRESASDFSHRPGCDCDNCTSVRELGDAREAGREAAKRQRAFLEGVRRGLEGR